MTHTLRINKEVNDVILHLHECLLDVFTEELINLKADGGLVATDFWVVGGDIQLGQGIQLILHVERQKHMCSPFEVWISYN